MNTTQSIPYMTCFLTNKGYLVHSVLLFLAIFFSEVNAQVYQVYVAAESEDVVQRVSFDANTYQGWVDVTTPVGKIPTETDGPHGLTISPDKKHWFVTIAHGNPYGYLAKYSTDTHELMGTVDLGLFPASMEISEFTGLLYTVNFNLHGEMEPSSMMVVDPETMDLIAELPTGIMPHGTRMNANGTKAYHVSMMSDELIEVDTYGFKISRTLSLKTPMKSDAAGNHEHEQHSPMTTQDLEAELKAMEGTGGRMGWMKEMNSPEPTTKDNHHSMQHHAPTIKPTWADPHPNGQWVYVAGNGSDEIIEIDIEKWTISRRFTTGKSPYNLEVSPNGKYLVSSLKGAGATSIIDLQRGVELARIPNSRKVSHGVAISPDSKYAFISVEGIGGEPGSVDVISIETQELVSFVETGKQAGGISFFTTLP